MLETEEILPDSNLQTILATIENMLRNVTEDIITKYSSELEAIKKVQIQQKNSDSKSLEYEVKFCFIYPQ